MFSFERKVGRLCELRVSGVLKADEMSQFRSSAAAAMMTHAGRVVFCSDLRGLDLLAPDVFDQLVTMLRTDNPKIERNALVVTSRPVSVLQLQRLVVEAGSPSRKVFRVENEAVTWLAEVLTVEEAARLKVFLSSANAT